VITTGHLCAGYDGLGRALTLAGVDHTPLWVSEVYAPAAAILRRELPATPNPGDLTTPGLWDDAPGVDILTAGFPCQPISIAGNQLAENDPRWLWPGVLAVIKAVRPERVFLENVAAITSIQKGAILALILDDLRQAGYAVRWMVMGACAVGAPHHRHRWFLVGDPVAGPAAEAVRVNDETCGAPINGPRRVLPTPNARDGGSRGTPTPEHARRRIEHPQRSTNLEDAIMALLPDETWGKYADAVNLWEQITGIPAPCPNEPAPRGGRRLSANLPEWMMGLPPGFLTGTRSERLIMAGNGVVPLQAAAAYQKLSVPTGTVLSTI
jgi:DNA (cytosine-5)-methyltransferase 1